MLDILATRCVKPIKVTWDSPNVMSLDIDDGNGLVSYTLLKGAENYIHKQVNFKVATSKDVFKKSPEIWAQLKDRLLAEAGENGINSLNFALDNEYLVFVITGNSIVDIYDFRNAENEHEFLEHHQKYIIDVTTAENNKKMFTDGSNGLLRLVLWDKDTDIVSAEYTTVLLLDINYQKSQYKVFSGIFMYKDFIFVPYMNCDIEEDSLCSFISDYDSEILFQYANERAEELYDNYMKFQDNNVEVSVRELSNLLRKVGYKLELDNVDKLAPISNINDEENNKRIQDFYNTFSEVTGENALDILQLSDFKKTFRYNKITLIDVLGILSKEYLTYDGAKITADILSSIVYKLFDNKSVDKVQVESIKHDKNLY